MNKWVLPLCWTAVLLDGFDLVVLGTVIPSLLQEKLLTTASASAVSTAGLVGMMLGALIIGTITDVIGRRKVMIYAVAGFSVFTLACAFAPDATTFGILRFLAGLGLGGCLPTAIALVNEARPQQGGRATTLIMTGYHVGAVITALLGIVLIPQLGWRSLFVVGALPALVLIPLMVKNLPETVTRRAPALEAVGSLFKPGLRKATIAFWVASFMGLLLVYGLNTWLPQIMRSAGYELGTALALLLTLNIGAVIGLLVSRRGGGPDRDQARGHRVVLGGCGVPGVAEHQVARLRGVRGCASRRVLRVQCAGARLCLRRAGLRGESRDRHRVGHAALDGWVPSVVRCWAVRCSRLVWRTRGASTRLRS